MGKSGKERKSSKFGEQIRKLRLSKHMSLGDLAAIVDTSRSFLSQIEQGKTLPSLGTLKSIAAALEVTVGSLIDEPAGDVRDPVLRKADRPKIERLQAGVTIEAMTYRDIHKTMEPIQLKLSPGATSGHESYVHHGQEFGLVIKGSLTVEIDGVEHMMEEGDTIYFDSSRPHRFKNPSDGDTEAMWVVTPPTF